MVPKNNQTLGQSAYCMINPGRPNFLDYAHVASLACPNALLLYNGSEDPLFPVEAVEQGSTTLRQVWESQGVGERLVTKVWPVPHVFSVEMQEEAFAFLDRHLKD
jgi:hypothetical protein